MSLRNILTNSMIIVSGLASASVTALASPYVELRWSVNPLTLITPWMAVIGLMLGLSVRPRQKPWPFIPAIAVLLCSIQLYLSQTFWTSRDFQRMQNSHQSTVDLDTFYIVGIKENNPYRYDYSGGGMRALPNLGKKRYLPFFANLGLWSISTVGVAIAVKKLNSRGRYPKPYRLAPSLNL